MTINQTYQTYVTEEVMLANIRARGLTVVEDRSISWGIALSSGKITYIPKPDNDSGYYSGGVIDKIESVLSMYDVDLFPIDYNL